MRQILQWWWRGGLGVGYSGPTFLPSCPNLLRFHGGGGGLSGLAIPERGILENLNQNFNHLSKLVHHSSLSHTTYVETNDRYSKEIPLAINLLKFTSLSRGVINQQQQQLIFQHNEINSLCKYRSNSSHFVNRIADRE